MLYSKIQHTIPRYSSVAKCHMVSQHTPNFIYVHKKVMAFVVPVFIKVPSTQQDYAKIHPSSPKSDNKHCKHGHKFISATQ